MITMGNRPRLEIEPGGDAETFSHRYVYEPLTKMRAENRQVCCVYSSFYPRN